MLTLHRQKLYLILGTIAAWLFCLSDYLMDMQGMFDERFYRPFINMPHVIALYGCISMFAFPMLALGLSQILRAAKLNRLVAVTCYYLFTVPMIIHTSFIYYYYVVNSTSSEEYKKQLLVHFDAFKNVFGAIYFVGLLIISLLLFVQILRGKSAFPRYLSLLNPIVGIVILGVLKLLLPDVASIIYPLLVPASFLAYLVTACSIYLFKHPEIFSKIKEASII